MLPRLAHAPRMHFSDAHEDRNSLRSERLRVLARHVPTIAFANIVNAALTAWVLRDSAPASLLLCWAATVAALALWRLRAQGRDVKVTKQSAQTSKLRHAIVLSALSGALWGLAGAMFFPAGDLAAQIFLAFVMGGMAAGAAVTLSSIPAAAIAYIVADLGPLGIQFALQALAAEPGAGVDLAATMTIMLCIYAAALMLVVRNGDAFVTLASKRARVLAVKLAQSEAAREAALRETEAAAARAHAAEEANRLKTEFLANMSHELRTPLNAVIGFSEIIESEMLGPVGQRRYKAYAGDIVQSGRHLLAVVNDILDVAKIEAGHMELRAMPVDALATAKECLRLIEPRAMAGGITLAFDQHLEGTTAVVNADALRLRQVLLNLLSNAVKFTRPGGEVVVTVNDANPNEHAISIADTGIGMDEAALEIALMPFRQAAKPLARKQEGTGLGLPLAKRLVELMGGVLEIDSTPGRGTTVQVRLPAAAA